MHDFSNLLKPSDMASDEQLAFRAHILKSNKERENSWTDEDINEEINKDFAEDEVRSIVLKTKSGKAPGLDGLMSDVYKNDASI